MLDHPPRTVRDVRALFAAEGGGARTSLGQHFLVDPNLRDAIVADTKLGPAEWVLEVGVGLGVLTEALLGRGASVLGIEVDRRVLAHATRLLHHDREPLTDDTTAEVGAPAEDAIRDRVREPGLHLLAGSALARKDLAPGVVAALNGVRSAEPETRLRLIANLPYQVASPVLIAAWEWRPHGIAAGRRGIDGVGIMVQREVAERMVAAPGTDAYGGLSVLCQAHGAHRITRRIPKSVFFPPPKVESAFVLAEAHDPIGYPFGLDAAGYARFKDTVHAVFQYRRKRLAKSLQFGLRLAPDVIRDTLATLAINGDDRGETLAPEQFAEISRALPSAASEG